MRNIKTRHKFEFNLEEILKDLVYARILSPSSKKAAITFLRHYLKNLNINYMMYIELYLL